MSRCSKELFPDACGLSGPLRLNIEAGGKVESRAFERPFVVIGRDPAMDLVLGNEQVSRKHAYLQVIAGRVFCIDLNSRSGVHWDYGSGQSGWVNGQEGVRIGPFRIRAEGVPGPADWEDPLRTSLQTDSPSPTTILEFPQLAEQRPRRVSRTLTLLGRAPECQLRWLDSEISKFHCSLLSTPKGVWVIDLLGRGGIAVNGQRARWKRLEPDDQLQVGRYLIRIRFTTSPDASLESEMIGTPSVPSRPAQSASLPAIWGGPTGGRKGSFPLQRRDSEAEAGLPAVMGPYPGRGVVEAQDIPAQLKAELLEPILNHMADQFGQMQQQMCDQFQQSMMMMAQMFGALHRDQLERAREELNQIRQLNQDFLSLQAELATRTPVTTSATGPTPGDSAVIDALVRIEALLRSSPPQQGLLPSEGGPSESRSVESGPKRASSPPPTAGGGHGTPGNGAIATEGRDPVERIDGPSSDAGSKPNGDRPEDLPDESVYSLLHQRIAAIQRERQGRWQRVLELMLGR